MRKFIILFLLLCTYTSLQTLANTNQTFTKQVKYYYPDGKLKQIGFIKNGKKEKEWKLYHQNGNLEVIAFFQNGEPDGQWKAYHKNGKLKLIAFFQNGNPMGEWRYYDENENLIKTENYKNENSEDISKNYYGNKKINSNNLIYTYINEGDFLYNKDSKSIPYEIYYNFRFNFYVDYPTKYFKFLPPPENGDGRAMTTEDEKVYLSFSGMNNIFDTSIEDEYYEKLNSIKPSDVAYKFLGKTFYSLSYYEGDKIIFLKKMYDNSQNAYITLYFEYDKLYKDFMNPIITRMTNSIKYNHNNSSLKNPSSSNQISYVESIGYLEILDDVYDQVINLKNEDYLLNFSKTDLAFIRNTLYARRGYIFKKKEYKNYFENTSWYIGTTANQNILSPDEEKLANIIKKYETR